MERETWIVAEIKESLRGPQFELTSFKSYREALQAANDLIVARSQRVEDLNRLRLFFCIFHYKDGKSQSCISMKEVQ